MTFFSLEKALFLSGLVEPERGKRPESLLFLKSGPKQGKHAQMLPMHGSSPVQMKMLYVL